MKFRVSYAAIAAIVLAVSPAAMARGSHAGGSYRSTPGYHYVQGHTTRTGTYVRGHYQTNPNHTRNDNWSTRGNVNPFTGERGTKPR